MRDKHMKWILLIPALLVLFATTVYPLIDSFRISLHEWDLKRSLTIGRFVGLSNYKQAFLNPEFWNSFWATAFFTISTVVLIVILGIAIGLLLSKDKPYITFIRTLLIIPFAMSPALVGYSWRFMLDNSYGLFHKIFGAIIPPLANVTWLGDAKYAMIALISCEVWIWLPFMSLLIMSGLMSIPKDVYEAAKVDGASAVQCFFKITIPLLRPILLVATILMTMFALKIFDPVVTLTNGGPGNATNLLNYSIYQTGFRFFDMGYAAAIGYILTFILVGMQVIYMRRLVKGGGWR